MDQPIDLVHEVALTPGSLLFKICKTRVLGVNSTHHQGMLEPAELFMATARSQDGIVEAMELKPEHSELLPFLLSVQFHPERLVQKHARYRTIFEKFVTVCAKPIKTMKGKILIVDDEADLRAMLKSILRGRLRGVAGRGCRDPAKIVLRWMPPM